MVVVLSEIESLPFITKNLDKWMGDFSYPIYLIHYQVGLLVVFVLGIAGFEYKRPDLVLMFISIPFIFVAAWIFTVAIEKPLDLVRTKVKRIDKRISINTQN